MMYIKALAASAVAVSVLAAVPVRGDAGASADLLLEACAFDATTGLCVPADLQAADAAALTVTGMLAQCMARMPMSAEGGCSPGAPDFCVPHEFSDEPGMLFCVNQGFSGTSYAEFENIEEAAMNCIGMELAEECQPALIAWYEALGCSSCADVEFAVRACMMRATAAECGDGAADPRAASILFGPAPSGPAAPVAASAPTPAAAQLPVPNYSAYSPYGDGEYYGDANLGAPSGSYFDYLYTYADDIPTAAPGPVDAYGPYEAYGPDPFSFGSGTAPDVYAYTPYEAYSPGPYAIETYYGIPPYDPYNVEPEYFEYPPYYFDKQVDYAYAPYEYSFSAGEPVGSPEAGSPVSVPAVSRRLGGEGLPTADTSGMRRMRRARRMRPADPARMRRMRMQRMRRMRRMRHARMG